MAIWFCSDFNSPIKSDQDGLDNQDNRYKRGDRTKNILPSALVLPLPPSQGNKEGDDGDDGIVTTPEELEAFYIIKSILREVIDTSRIQYKDTRTYFGINLDGKARQTICRLWFNEKTGHKTISILDNLEPKKQAATNLENLDQIYGVAEFLKARVKHLTQDSYASQPEQSEIM